MHEAPTLSDKYKENSYLPRFTKPFTVFDKQIEAVAPDSEDICLLSKQNRGTQME